MMTLNGFLHPALAFIALAMALPFFRGKQWKWFLLVPPVIAIGVVLLLHLVISG